MPSLPLSFHSHPTPPHPQLKPVGVMFERLLRKPKPLPPKKEENVTVTINANSTDGNDTAPVDPTAAAAADEKVNVGEDKGEGKEGKEGGDKKDEAGKSEF
jgi:hypothetical protein